MKKEDKERLRLFLEAWRYPLALRMAVKLHLEGLTSRELIIRDNDPIYPEPLRCSVANFLSDLEKGSLSDGMELDKGEIHHRIKLRTLRQLAMAL